MVENFTFNERAANWSWKQILLIGSRRKFSANFSWNNFLGCQFQWCHKRSLFSLSFHIHHLDYRYSSLVQPVGFSLKNTMAIKQTNRKLSISGCKGKLGIADVLFANWAASCVVLVSKSRHSLQVCGVHLFTSRRFRSSAFFRFHFPTLPLSFSLPFLLSSPLSLSFATCVLSMKVASQRQCLHVNLSCVKLVSKLFAFICKNRCKIYFLSYCPIWSALH